MDDRDAVIWLHRRAGFGLASGDLADAIRRGPAAELESLLAPEGPVEDPWAGLDLPLDPRDRASRLAAVDRWIDGMVATTTPLIDRMAWFWHGHLVSGLDKVKVGRLMVDQLQLFRHAGLGSFTELLRSVTIDPAMMTYLDLRTSTGSEPNENFAREVLELFTVGVGAYDEADVRAGAVALTGWRLQDGQPRFQPRRHDDTPQTYLGVGGVHDLDTVVDAIRGHAALPAFIASSVSSALLGLDGTSAPDLVESLATTFRDSDLDVRSLVRATLTAGLAGANAPMVLGPLPWLVIALRTTGAAIAGRPRLQLLRAAGHLPMSPPNVAGWPGGPAWFASSTVVARTNLAALVAAATPATSPVATAATAGDHTALSIALGVPGAGFGPATVAALDAATTAVARITLALVSPELVIV